MAESDKRLSEYDQQQIMQKSYNKEGSTLGVDGFVVGKVGRKIDRAVTTTTVTDDTEVYTFTEDGNTLYTLTIIYTDGTRESLLSVERTQ